MGGKSFIIELGWIWNFGCVSFVKWETGADFFSQQFTLNFLPDILEASVTPFITPILKSLVVPVIWLALTGAIYSRIPPFFALDHNFFPIQWGYTKNKTTNQGNQSNCRKIKGKESYVANFATVFDYLILKSCVWFQPKLHFTKFSYHYKSISSDEGLVVEMSALKFLAVVNLWYQLCW